MSFICTVCKNTKSEENGSGDSDGVVKGGLTGWAVTTDRLPTSQVQIMFKLYEILKREFLVGHICGDCHMLLDQADSLQFQLHAVTKGLKDRIDKHCDFSKEREYAEVNPGYKQKYKSLRDARSTSINEKTRETLENVQEKIIEQEDNLPLVEDGPKGDVSRIIAEIRQNFTVCGQSTKRDFKLNMSFWANITDPDYVKRVLCLNNFDENCSVFLGSRSVESLLFDGYMWERDPNHRLRKTSTLVNAWKCNKSKPKDKYGTLCKAKVSTLIDDSMVILDSVEIEHNHPRNDENIRTEVFRVKLKEIAAAQPTMNPAQIVTTCEILYGKEYSVSFASLVQYVSNLQQRMGAPRRQDAHVLEPKPKKMRTVEVGTPPVTNNQS